MDNLTIEDMLKRAGYDLRDPHFKETPVRFAKTILEEYAANRTQEKAIRDILSRDFPEDYSGMVVSKFIEFQSMCPHHLLPFFGHAHVGYLPEGEVVGISKLARLVTYLTHTISTQEALTNNIIQSIEAVLKPRGAIAILSAVHTCMVARGARQASAITVTSDCSGFFAENKSGCKDEFLQLIQGSHL